MHRSYSVHYTSAGAPQGTVLFPVLFTVYTDDCIGSEEYPVVKFSDDTDITIQTCQNPTSHSLTLCTGSLSGCLIITLILML